jgi:hypothetical protein
MKVWRLLSPQANLLISYIPVGVIVCGVRNVNVWRMLPSVSVRWSREAASAAVFGLASANALTIDVPKGSRLTRHSKAQTIGEPQRTFGGQVRT